MLKSIDPVTFELVKNTIDSTVDEMTLDTRSTVTKRVGKPSES